MKAYERKPKLSFAERKPHWSRRAKLVAEAQALAEATNTSKEKPQALKDLEKEIGREAMLAGWDKRKPGRPRPE